MTDGEQLVKMLCNPLYYESHVTIDPSDRLEELKVLCAPFKYKVAQLYMKKGEQLALSDLDQFMTGHSREFVDINDRQEQLIMALTEANFVVRRFKIEAVIQDSRAYREQI